MARIEPRPRADGIISYRVKWNLGGTRTGAPQVETFAAGTSAKNRIAAERFLAHVDDAGQQWPQGWIKGHGYVRAEEQAAPPPERSFEDVGLEYVEQNLDCSPGQRKRYKQQIRTFKSLGLIRDGQEFFPFDQPIGAITEADIRLWRRHSTASLKTQANYHGILSSVFSYAMKHGYINEHPALVTAPKRKKVKQQQGEMRCLTEREFAIVVRLAEEHGDFLQLLGGTAARYGEATALWVSDIDLKHRTIRINKAWKVVGEDDETDIPPWLSKHLRPHHRMRGHYLGTPKTPEATRTIGISKSLAAILARRMVGKNADDFLFTSPEGLALHNGDFTESVWLPLMAKCRAAQILPFRKHDLRHSHVAWLIAAGVPIPNIQRRLGHADYQITVNTYGHLLPQTDDHIDEAMDAVLAGTQVRNPHRPAFRVIQGGNADVDLTDEDEDDDEGDEETRDAL